MKCFEQQVVIYAQRILRGKDQHFWKANVILLWTNQSFQQAIHIGQNSIYLTEFVKVTLCWNDYGCECNNKGGKVQLKSMRIPCDKMYSGSGRSFDLMQFQELTFLKDLSPNIDMENKMAL